MDITDIPDPNPRPRSGAGNASHHSRSGNHLPRHLLNARLRAIRSPGSASAGDLFPRTRAPWHISDDDLVFLRNRVHDVLPSHGSTEALYLNHAVFNVDSILESYFFIRHREGYKPPPGVLGQVNDSIVIPFDLAWRAAERARDMTLITPNLKELAFCAGLLYSCGLFHVSRMDAMEHSSGPIDMKAANQMRGVLLKEPLEKLREEDPDFTNLMAAVFGMPHERDVDPEEVGRLGTAVYCANMSVNAVWLTSGR